MILALLLQMATFQQYVEEARAKLGIAEPVRVEVFDDEITHPYPEFAVDSGRLVGWYVPGGPIYVHNSVLAQASRDAQKVIAYHEACHVYMETMQRQARTPFQKQLIHNLQRHCTVETLGDDFQRILRRLSNGYYRDLGTFHWWRNQCQTPR